MTTIINTAELIEQYMLNYNCLCYFDNQCVLDQFAEMEDYDACIQIREQMKCMKNALPILNTVQQQDLIPIDEMLFNIIELIQHHQQSKKHTIVRTLTPQLKVIQTIIEDHPFELTRRYDHCQKKQVFEVEKMSDCPCEVNLLKAIPSLFDKLITIIEKQQDGRN